MKLAFLAVLVVFLVLPLTYASVGMGISDYDSNTTITGSTTIKVGQVTNTGNETLTFSYVWKQTNSTVNMTLPVTCGLQNITLQPKQPGQPSQSFEPEILIGNYNESFVGNYSGVVEIKGSYPAQGEGDMVVPGAECHVTLIVNDLPDQHRQQDPLYLVVVIVCVFGILSGIGTYYYARTRKLRRKL